MAAVSDARSVALKGKLFANLAVLAAIFSLGLEKVLQTKVIFSGTKHAFQFQPQPDEEKCMITALSVVHTSVVSSSNSTKIKPQGEPELTSLEPNPSSVVTLSAEAIQRSSVESSAIHYGYSADGTYFGSPAEFFTSQKAHYQQLGYEVSDEWMAYFKNEIMHPNPEGGAIAAPPLRASADSIKFNDVLTDRDKALIQRVSPSLDEGSGPKPVNGLAVVIALERAQGNLQGEIDAAYAGSLKNRLLSAKSDVLPVNMLDKLIAAVSVDLSARSRTST